jgi:hypothetical protein
MDLSTVPRGALIAGISGLALFIIMFFSWFEAPEVDFGVPEVTGAVFEAAGVDTTISAWEAFDFIDIVLLLTVIAAVGLVVMAAAGSSVNLPVAASAITAGLGVVATLLVLYRIIDTPFDYDRKFGVFLGLIAAAGVAVGGWLAMQEEGTTFGGERDRLSDRYGGGPPPPGGTGTGPGAPPPPPSTGP